MQLYERMNAKTKLLLASLFMASFTLITGYIGISNTSKLNEAVTTLYERDLVGTSEVYEVKIARDSVARNIRQAILEKDPTAVREAINVSEKAFTTAQETLKKSHAKMATEQGRRNIEEALSELDAYMANARQCAQLSLEGKKDEAFAVLKTNVHGPRIDALIDDVIRLKLAIGAKMDADTNALYTSSRNFSLGVLAVAFFACVMVGLYFSNWFGKALTETAQIAEFVSRSSRELAAATEDIASGAQEQAASIEETAATLEELTSTVKQNADSAQQAAQLASASRETAEKGGKVVSDAVTAMKEVNQSARKIADITTTIDEIAFQTNILAINAAVEAARAGEQGRGFAVVASEVRSLAERSALATKEIKALIDDSASKIENGYRLVETSGAALGEILGSVKRVTDFVGEIAAASREQSSGIDQVNKAVTQMDQVTQANAAQTEELSGTTESLASQSERLRTVVEQFHLTASGIQVESGTTLSPRKRSVAPSASAPRVGSRIRRGAPVTRLGGSTAVTKPVEQSVVAKREPAKTHTDSDAELDHAFEEI